MKCDNCNVKIKKEDIFCPECGKNLKKKDYLKNINNLLVKYKMKILYTLIAIIVVCMGIKIINYFTSPVFLANTYIKAIASNDYSKIYELINLDNSDLVSETVLKNKTEKLDIEEYKLENIEYYEDQAMATFVYTKNNKSYRVSVMMTKAINKQFLFFDKWNINSSKVANDVIIKVPTKSTVLIDDLNIENYLEKTENGLDIYVIDEMVTGEYNIKVNLESGLSVTDDIEITSNKVFTIGNIEISDDLQNTLTEKVNAVLNPIYTNIINSVSYKNSGLTNLESTYKNINSSLNNKYYKLKSITFKNSEFSSATYEGSNLVTTYDVTYEYNLEYTYGSEVKTYTNTGTTTISVIYDYSSEFTIKEINGLPTSFRLYINN